MSIGPSFEHPFAAGVKPVVITVIRVIISSAVVLTVFFRVPVGDSANQSDVPFLALHVVLFAVIVAIEIPVIIRSKHPGLRSVEATILTILIFLTLFARIYLSISVSDPTTFNESLNHLRALYFTTAVFATVGFGDIVATTDAVRLVVTVQMVLNLVVIGVVVKVLFTAGTRGMERRRDEQSSSQEDEFGGSSAS
ncbi:MAG: potassium channel family protein [Microlunatus sp.]|nr:potassium channel family protein [Microlunatus sp.]MDN5770794.1 potassium channel family protein [Microlunatus sp.]